MKLKHSVRHIQLALIGIPLLVLSPVVHAQDPEIEKKTADKTEIKEAEETAAAERAEDAAERAKERAEDAAKRAQERAEKSAERNKEKAARIKEASEKEKPDKSEEAGDGEKPDTPARGGDRGETQPAPEERPERRPAPDRLEDRERGERPATPDPAADRDKSPVEIPVLPTKRPDPREEAESPDDDERAAAREDPADPDKLAEPEPAEPPTTGPERKAESEVADVTRDVQRDLDQRKTRIEGREDAQALFDEILGAESRISRAEIAREERFRPRLERQRPGEERVPEVSPAQRREATTYFQQRLRGREVEGPPPEFFGRSRHRRDRRDPQAGEFIDERIGFTRPRYLNEGRRYVHYDSRSAIPAILMAAQAMNQVRFQPAREIAPIFYGRQEVSAPRAMPLPPENYRGDDSWVVSYPVDEQSMVSSEDILFLQGSTQFSDPYSYEVVGALADAMKAMPGEERFVIEGHASAEGSYDSNMVLSQQRAEHIVREIVRRGVSPYRLLPVGYGESEARHPADADERLRRQDRRVVVFRMKPELVVDR